MTKEQAFQILEVDETASPIEIKQAWKDMLFFWHPDRYQDNERRRQFAEEKTKLINEAFDRIQNGRFDETQTEYPKQNGNQPPDPPWTPPNNPKKKSRKLVNRVVFAILACYLLLIITIAAWLESDSQPQNEPPETTHVYPNEEPVSAPITEPLRSPERESVPAVETQATPPTQPNKEKPKPPVEKKIQPYWLNDYRMYHQRTQSTAEIAREVNLLIEKAQIEILEAEIKYVGLTDIMLHVQDQLNRKREAHRIHESYTGKLRVSQLDEEWLKDQIKTEKAVTRWREQGMTTKEIFDAVKTDIQIAVKIIADHEKKYPKDRRYQIRSFDEAVQIAKERYYNKQQNAEQQHPSMREVAERAKEIVRQIKEGTYPH